ncbi:MAG: hypothetical protein M3O50_15565 [Myxococcota bacterium]|nr:hypothetical protein [Myxococcota bacterium]
MNKAPRRMMMGVSCLLVSGVLGHATVAHAQPPPAPTGIESHPDGSGKIMLFWNAVSGATSYRVYRATSSGAEAATPRATTTTGVNNGTTYFYNVAATNSVGISPDTNEITATPSSRR